MRVQVGLVQGRLPCELRVTGVVGASLEKAVGSRIFQAEEVVCIKAMGAQSSMAFVESCNSLVDSGKGIKGWSDGR